ncbi:MAG: phage major tail protein, TP901-1 family [Alphaproteobacteria bacterium]|nr:phage major tail protein, TP901-1 family [Alphaproteobacteria bacterium]
MAGQRGRDVLIQIGDGQAPEAFATVAGIRAKTIALNAGLVDATTADSPDAWRELIAGAGAKRADVSGAGVFKDAASDERMRAAYFSGQTINARLVIPGFGTLAGPFVIAELSYGGEHDAEATFAVKLASAGAVTFAAG